MVSKNQIRKTIAVEENFWNYIEHKRKKNENLEDTLRRLLKYKTRKGTK